MFRNRIACIEAKDIHPVVDKVFPFEQLKEAYEYQWSQAHIGKMVLKIDWDFCNKLKQEDQQQMSK